MHFNECVYYDYKVWFYNSFWLVSPSWYASTMSCICWLFLEASTSIRHLSLVPAPFNHRRPSRIKVQKGNQWAVAVGGCESVLSALLTFRASWISLASCCGGVLIRLTMSRSKLPVSSYFRSSIRSWNTQVWFTYVFILYKYKTR